jgi:cellulose synthase/poly-beta-1,6-N-acetylglucosamine synthase-like glycosyltransferase
MIALLEAMTTPPAIALLALAAFYALVVMAGAVLQKRAPFVEPGRIAVVVPAHNEEDGIKPTLEDIQRQLRPLDRLIVVADNCADGTAAVARGAGAEVIERRDETRRGKGYALQAAVDVLRADPPEIMCVVDADCRIAPTTILAISGAAKATARPAQALYLMMAPEGSGPRRAVAEFAWLLMNKVRTAGLAALFDTARLCGSGMAFPFHLLERRSLATGEIVEDLSLSLELAAEKTSPVFCADVAVLSEFPSSDAGAAKQHARWEHGSLRMATRRAPSLLMRGLFSGNFSLAALALDVMIPPLTLFFTLLVGALALAFAAATLGAGAALPFALVAITLFTFSTAFAWMTHGQKALPPRALGALFGYVLGKRKVYGAAARQSTKTWTRTERAPGGGKGAA